MLLRPQHIGQLSNILLPIAIADLVVTGYQPHLQTTWVFYIALLHILFKIQVKPKNLWHLPQIFTIWSDPTGGTKPRDAELVLLSHTLIPVISNTIIWVACILHSTYNINITFTFVWVVSCLIPCPYPHNSKSVQIQTGKGVKIPWSVRTKGCTAPFNWSRSIIIII